MAARDQVECCEPGWREMSAIARCDVTSSLRLKWKGCPVMLRCRISSGSLCRQSTLRFSSLIAWSARCSQCAIQYGGPSNPPARASRRL